MKTLKQRGIIKKNIKNMLFQSENIKSLLIGECHDKKTIDLFNQKVKSHLFIDDTLTDKETLIFFDVVCPRLTQHIKECRIILYGICHRDLLDVSLPINDYFGNRADVLANLIEECLLDKSNAKQFGIGELSLDSVDIYNSTNYYGVQMIFSVNDFR